MTNPRESFRAIARNLGIDELTVRERLQKLRSGGFLKGWRLFFNPNLFGFVNRQLLVDVEGSRKDELIKDLSSMQNVFVIVEHIGPSMNVGLVAEDDKSMLEQVRQIQALVGKLPPGFSIPFPPTNINLSSSDIEIIRALSTDPRKKYSVVAKDLKLSTRTVKRRLTRLIDGKAIFAFPTTDPGSLEGAMVGDLLVRYAEHESSGKLYQELASKLQDHLITVSAGDSNYAFFSFFITRISAIKEVLERVRSIKGIGTARLDIVQNRIEFYDRLSALFERRLPPLVGVLPKPARS
jgi:DNA-binding Lrp family transcriptional regulator